MTKIFRKSNISETGDSFTDTLYYPSVLMFINLFCIGVTRAVDLCAAPGSWSQVLVKKLR